MMKKKLFAVLFFMLCAASVRAQFTTVTATVQDSTGIPYSGAVMNAVLVGGSGSYTLNGQPYSGKVGPVTLSSAGAFTAQFGDVTLITPGSPQWQITITMAPGIPLPFGTGPQQFTYTSSGTTISGSSPVSLTSALNALAPKLTNFAGTGGTVSSASCGNLTPLFNCSVATPTSTPAFSFTQQTAAASTVFAGPGSGAAANPTFQNPGGMSVINTARSCVATPNCTTIVGDMNFDVDATFTASSPTVTTSSAAPAFISGSVPTQVGFGTSGCNANSEASCINNCPQSTMTFVSAHVVTLSNNCVNNSSAAAHSNIFIWCTDDGTALSTAFNLMFPAGGNSAQTQELDLPAGGMCMGNNPFVAPPFGGGTVRANPLILRGHNTEIVPLPNMSCNSTKGCLIYTGFSNNQLGNIGSSDAIYDITFWGGGTSDKGASATFSTPAYGIYGTYGANYYNVWVIGWVWSRACTTPAYGWRLSGSNTFGSGDYAGGNFGAITSGFNGAPTSLFGGNWGAGICSDILVSGAVGDGGVSTHGIYFDQPQENVPGQPHTCPTPAVSQPNCYPLQVTAGSYRDFGSNPAGFVNGGDAWFTGSNMTGFGALDDFNMSSGTAAFSNTQFFSHIEQSGGILTFNGGNHSSGSTAPFVNPAFQTMTGGSAIAYKSVTGTCTGTVPASGTTAGLYGTGDNITSTVCATIGGTTIGSGIVMQHAGTMGMLQVSAGTGGVNSSSGAFTVLKNGSATTITCTVGTGTVCRDVTHYVSYAVGDLISIDYTSQALDTLANITASVMVEF